MTRKRRWLGSKLPTRRFRPAEVLTSRGRHLAAPRRQRRSQLRWQARPRHRYPWRRRLRLAPPSIHPSGKLYAWSASAKAIAPAPQGLLDRLQRLPKARLRQSLRPNGTTSSRRSERGAATTPSHGWCGHLLRATSTETGAGIDARAQRHTMLAAAAGPRCRADCQQHRRPRDQEANEMDEANVFRLAELNRSGRARTASLLVFATKHADNSALRCQMGDVDGVGRHALGRRDAPHTFDRVRDRCRDASAKANAQTVAAIERLARADRRMAARSDQWDMDTWLAICRLCRQPPHGEIRPHSPEDHLTRDYRRRSSDSLPDAAVVCISRG